MPRTTRSLHGRCVLVSQARVLTWTPSLRILFNPWYLGNLQRANVIMRKPQPTSQSSSRSLCHLYLAKEGLLHRLKSQGARGDRWFFSSNLRSVLGRGNCWRAPSHRQQASRGWDRNRTFIESGAPVVSNLLQTSRLRPRERRQCQAAPGGVLAHPWTSEMPQDISPS